MKKQPPTIITGMHRSGTSLFASYLNLCGLDLGEDLVPKEIDNPKGYFEDSDFVKFHKKILRKNHTLIYLPFTPKLDPKDIEQLRALLREKAQPKSWGWKDPRTVLFLDYYKKYSKKANYIFLYRDPFLTVDSLIRRKTERLTKVFPFIAAQSWLWYNQKILDFIISNPKQSLLFNLETFINHPQKAIKVINSKFSLELSKDKALEEVYAPKLLKRKQEFGIKTQLTNFFFKHKLKNTFNKLKSKEKNIL